MIALALDGPCNGQYIDADEAYDYGYYGEWWPTGEFVWVNYRTLEDFDA